MTDATSGDEPPLLASDADRDRFAAVLQDALATGRLTREEFDSRLDGVLRARTRAELDRLVADVPAPRADEIVGVSRGQAQVAGDPPDLALVVPVVAGAVATGGAFVMGAGALLALAPVLVGILVVLAVLGRRR